MQAEQLEMDLAGPGDVAGGSCDAAMCDDKNPCTDDVCTAGACSNPANDDLMPSDGNPCTVDTCKGGVASHANAAAGTTCAANKICNASGECMCTKDFQCGAPMGCITPTCDPVMGCVMKGCDEAAGETCYNDSVCVSCTNALKDGSESDVDCGGTCATKCAAGKDCNGNADCAGGNCSGGKCM